MRNWTRAEEGKLREWRRGRAKVKYDLIARRLGRTLSAVAKKLRRMRLTRRRKHPRRPNGAVAALVAPLVAPGVTDKAIALKLGVSRQLVQRARAGLKLPPGVPNPAAKKGATR